MATSKPPRDSDLARQRLLDLFDRASPEGKEFILTAALASIYSDAPENNRELSAELGRPRGQRHAPSAEPGGRGGRC